MHQTPKNREYILFIVTSFWAYGELSIALEVAERLKYIGVSPLFLIPPSHERFVKEKGMAYITLVPKAGNVNRCLMQEIELSYRPVYVILSDFFNYAFAERHYGICVDDLVVFSGAVGTFDLYDFNATGGKVDIFGNIAKEMLELSTEPCQFFLQPVPILHARPVTANNVYRYPLFQKIDERTHEDYEKSRKLLGVKRTEKILLFTSALWQHRRVYKNKNIPPFINACQKALENIFLHLPEDVTIISIGQRSLFTTQECQNFLHKDEMPAQDFKTYVNAADLFISNNYISTSMVKIVLSGIPTLLLSNSYLKRRNEVRWIGRKTDFEPPELKDCQFVYPFRFYPVGWYTFLEHIVKNNDFYSLVAQVELFDKEEVLTQIDFILNGTWEKKRETRLRYLSCLSKLNTVETIFQLHIAEGLR